MAVLVEVWGDYACFSRPEMKTERVSYDVITPSAARGLLEAVYWHPGLRWVIDRIYLLNPIRLGRQELQGPEKIKMTSIKRNEVKSKISAGSVRTVMSNGEGGLYLNVATDRNQRSSLILQDVHYIIEAHFDMTANACQTDNPGKFQDIMKRRLHRGQCFQQPYFGCREFPAYFREWAGGKIPAVSLTKDLGYMLYDMDYSDPKEIRPMFFRARLQDGVLDLRDCEVVM